jgi:predicted nuclease with TOPRIM domain
MSTEGRGAAAKRQRAAPVQDDRNVVVNSDVVRSEISGITAYVDTIISERDDLQKEVSKLKEEIEELTNKVGSLEFVEEENARLKNELDLSRISIENHRSREEQLSEENKRLVPDNMNLDTLIRRAGQYSNTIE